MRKAVRLAQAAKARFLLEHPFVQGDEIKIALSLGPFGSTRSTHEFDGIYPPPYGPAASEPASDADINYFVRDEDEEADGPSTSRVLGDTANREPEGDAQPPPPVPAGPLRDQMPRDSQPALAAA